MSEIAAEAQTETPAEEAEAGAKYFSKDFEWETLKQEVEANPSYGYHLLPFNSPHQQQQQQQHQQLQQQQQQREEDVEQSADAKAWQRFHTRHSSGKFFKERRYLLKEFPELVFCGEKSKVLEVGCGNGSTVIPILRGNKDITMYACDCSTETLERAKEIVDANNILSSQHRFHPFYCDFASTGFPKWLVCDSCHERKQGCVSGNGCCIGGIDFVTLIFTLSAVPLKRMPTAIMECFRVLKPGGLLLFRDYGLYDMTMLRFEPDQRVGFREYVRADGTRSYFFCLDSVRDLFSREGFIELELEYCCIKSVNRRQGKSMQRVWVHGKFQKPM